MDVLNLTRSLPQDIPSNTLPEEDTVSSGRNSFGDKECLQQIRSHQTIHPSCQPYVHQIRRMMSKPNVKSA